METDLEKINRLPPDAKKDYMKFFLQREEKLKEEKIQAKKLLQKNSKLKLLKDQKSYQAKLQL